MEKSSIEKPRSDWELGLREAFKDRTKQEIKDLILAPHILRPEDREWGYEYVAERLDPDEVAAAIKVLEKLAKEELE